MGLNQKWTPPTRPFPWYSVEPPGPAPFSQATQLTIRALPQSVYIPMIVGGEGISNEKGQIQRPIRHDGSMTELHALVVYTPATHTRQVLAALGDAGAGRIGNYTHCSFVTPGTGRFIPQEGAAPFLGSPGGPEEVAEDRIEGGGGAPGPQDVVAALRAVHPYEEPAFMSWPVNGWGRSADSSHAG